MGHDKAQLKFPRATKIPQANSLDYRQAFHQSSSGKFEKDIDYDQENTSLGCPS
jgi:hypothetical protein